MGEDPEITTLTLCVDDGIRYIGPALLGTGVFLRALTEESLNDLYDAFKYEYTLYKRRLFDECY